MTMQQFKWLFIFPLILLCTSASGDVINVPGDQPTIQAGIDAAADGDTVLVADGTYTGIGNRDLTWTSKVITLCSANGPDLCIIDCQNSGRGIYFPDATAAGSVVRGLTITNGSADFGGGIRCYCSVSLDQCVIKFSSAYSGGGIYFRAGELIVTSCTVLGNQALGSWGDGGGLFCEDGKVDVIDSTFIDNVAIDDHAAGGGIYGGFDQTIWLRNSLIAGNRAGYGGGIYHQAGILKIANCLILHNHARIHSGGGVSTAYANLYLRHCTVVGNSSTWPYGGGLNISQGPTPTVSNSIFFGNTPQQVSADDIEFFYCDVAGGWPGMGNIDADPLFVDPDGPDGDPGTWEDNDYHLTAGSPCVETGDPVFEPLGGETDIDGDDRVMDGDGDGEARVDMGADEYVQGGGSGTVSAVLTCSPSAGTLPFITNITVTLTNEYLLQQRRIAARMRINLANGQQWNNWRAGYTQLDPGASYIKAWNQTIPALPTLVGENVFNLFAEDVTPAPFNQPPYLPSGDTDSASCMVTALAP